MSASESCFYVPILPGSGVHEIRRLYVWVSFPFVESGGILTEPYKAQSRGPNIDPLPILSALGA